jgi:hypothetical protein
MTCYIVSFQAKELAVRQRLRERLRTYEKYCPINNTCWAVVSEEKPTEIRNSLKEILAPGDKLFVIRSGTAAAWTGLLASNSDWLKRNL